MEYKTLVLTYKREGELEPSPSYARIIEQAVVNRPINHKNKLVSVISIFLKIFDQVIFLARSVSHLHRFRPDVVHIYTPIPILIGFYCKFFFSSKVFVSLHGTDEKRIRSSGFLTKIMSMTDGVLVISRQMIDTIKIPRKKIYFMGNGIDGNIYKKISKIKTKKQIIHVGNFRWQKNHDLLVKAFNIFLVSHPGYRLVLVGTGGECNKIKKLAHTLNISKEVIFLGAKNPKEVNQLLNESEFFVLSSISEGSPKVVMESLATGTPVVSTDIGNVRDLIKEAGLIGKDATAESLASAMCSLHDNLGNYTSEKAIRVAKQYTWKSVSDRLDNIYKGV